MTKKEWYTYESIFYGTFLVVKMMGHYYTLRKVQRLDEADNENADKYIHIIPELEMDRDSSMQAELKVTYPRLEMDALIEKNMSKICDPFAWEPVKDSKSYSIINLEEDD